MQIKLSEVFIYKLISYIFEPFLVYLAVIIYYLFYQNNFNFVSYETFIYLFLPLLTFCIFLKINGLKNLDLSNYKLRKKIVFRAYPIFVLIMLVSVFFVENIKFHLLLTLCVSLWVISLLYIKTSAHVYFFITLPSIINLDLILVLLIFTISIFIAYSRFKLNRHTLKDLFVAYFLGVLYYLYYLFYIIYFILFYFLFV